VTERMYGCGPGEVRSWNNTQPESRWIAPEEVLEIRFLKRRQLRGQAGLVADLGWQFPH